MKLFKKMFGFLLSMCLICATVVPVTAANISYTVRLFPGKQGTITSGGICQIDCKHSNMPKASGSFVDGVYVIKGLHYGDQVSFRASTSNASVKDSKYYIRGSRESGKDNSTVSTGNPNNLASVQVTSDMDYVIAYGIVGDSVAYTVNFVDTDGNTLAPSETYYGNVGDVAVVAYLYIEGYQPQAYNLGRTLTSNAADNVFTFVYSPVGAGGGGGAGEGGEAGGAAGAGAEAGAGGAAGAGAGAGAGGAAGAGAGAGAGGAAGAGAGAADAGVNIPDEEVPAGAPEEYVNLDDEQVPLANLAEVPVIGDFAVMVVNLPTAVKIVIIGGALAGLAGLWYTARRRKRNIESER